MALTSPIHVAVDRAVTHSSEKTALRIHGWMKKRPIHFCCAPVRQSVSHSAPIVFIQISNTSSVQLILGVRSPLLSSHPLAAGPARGRFVKRASRLSSCCLLRGTDDAHSLRNAHFPAWSLGRSHRLLTSTSSLISRYFLQFLLFALNSRAHWHSERRRGVCS